MLFHLSIFIYQTFFAGVLFRGCVLRSLIDVVSLALAFTTDRTAAANEEFWRFVLL